MHPRRALGFGLVQEASFTPDDLTVTSEFPPPLIPDISSESDESDGFTSPPSGSDANAAAPNPLTFLPFASLPNLNIGENAFRSPECPKEEEEEQDYQYHRYEEGKRRRRKRDRGKGGREQCLRQRAYGSNMSIRDLEAKRTGISGEELEEDDEAEDADIAQSRYKSFCSGTSFGGYGLQTDEETCLGGF
jgi:hypothetical protein